MLGSEETIRNPFFPTSMIPSQCRGQRMVSAWGHRRGNTDEQTGLNLRRKRPSSSNNHEKQVTSIEEDQGKTIELPTKARELNGRSLQHHRTEKGETGRDREARCNMVGCIPR